jgi:hypothetical protein
VRRRGGALRIRTVSLDRSSLARYQDVIALSMLRAVRLPRERANNDDRQLRLAARNKQKRATKPIAGHGGSEP